MMTLAPPRIKPLPRSVSPQPLKWTCKQFHMLGDLGVFEGTRPMLIDGEILEQGTMNPPHAIAGVKTEELFHEMFNRKHWHLRSQKPLILGLAIDPQPDLAVIAGRPTVDHPTTAELIVEIADSSLKFDTTEKMSLYAAAGIPEYWVLDLTGRQLIVYRDPAPDSAAPHGATFRTTYIKSTTDQINPLTNPAVALTVAAMLD